MNGNDPLENTKDSIDQQFATDRFHDESIRVERQSLCNVCGLSVRRQHQNGCVSLEVTCAATNRPQQLESVHLSHLNVGDDRVEGHV